MPDNPPDHIAGRGAFHQRDVEYDAAGILNGVAADNIRDLPIGALHKHVRHNCVDHALWSRIGEYKNIIDA